MSHSKELPHLVNFQRVTVRVKVVGERDPVRVKDLMKQEYIIADSTGISKINCSMGRSCM